MRKMIKALALAAMIMLFAQCSEANGGVTESRTNYAQEALQG